MHGAWPWATSCGSSSVNSGSGSGQRRSRPGGEPATTHQQVVHLREMLLRLAGDFGSFAVSRYVTIYDSEVAVRRGVVLSDGV